MSFGFPMIFHHGSFFLLKGNWIESLFFIALAKRN